MTFSGALPSPRERHLRRSVPRSVFAVRLLSAFIYFLAQMKFYFIYVAELCHFRLPIADRCNCSDQNFA